jgi:FlaA1/EpsC-like NDP-sugar epimerase
LAYVASGLKQYTGGFLAEVGLFWLALSAFQAAAGHLQWETLTLGLAIASLGMGVGEAVFRLYRRVWSVAGLPDALGVLWCVLLATLVIVVANLALPDAIQPYRPLQILEAMPAAVGAIAFFRLFPRLRSLGRQSHGRLLVISAGNGFPTVKTMIEQRRSAWSPVAILTHDGSRIGQTVNGVRVIGRPDDILHWLSVLHVEGVAFVAARSEIPNWRSLLKICLDAELPVFMVSSQQEWLRGDSGRLRQLTADDLVWRSDRSLDIALSREFIEGRTVMVTGAGGSIGSEICRCLIPLQPRRIVLVENDESGLFDIAEYLRERSSAELREALVTIEDLKQLASVFVSERPDVVFHAAAYKHVPMLESHPLRAATTNVLGTWNVLSCAEASGTRQFVLISTDKAVEPHSVMGCTKRLCELMVLAHRGGTATWAVRFGNVVGSRGSVAPLFERQIDEGGPVTITHPQATRYLMTKREAASLTIATLRLAQTNRVYMLDMGEPVEILRLARSLIRSRGLRPGADIEIIFTGLRPGEVATERLMAGDEACRPTVHPLVNEIVNTGRGMDAEDLQWVVAQLRAQAEEGQADAVINTLHRATRGPIAMATVDLTEADELLATAEAVHQRPE